MTPAAGSVARRSVSFSRAFRFRSSIGTVLSLGTAEFLFHQALTTPFLPICSRPDVNFQSVTTLPRWGLLDPFFVTESARLAVYAPSARLACSHIVLRLSFVFLLGVYRRHSLINCVGNAMLFTCVLLCLLRSNVRHLCVVLFTVALSSAVLVYL